MLYNSYQNTRKRSVAICFFLKTEDYVVQPDVDISPPKWHLGHTTWFFETFILIPHLKGYQAFNSDYPVIFNSYYEYAGSRVSRADRGKLSRPTVEEVYQYRRFVDSAIGVLLRIVPNNQSILELITLGINHEEQHQELLITDIKYILGTHPFFPPYSIAEQKTIYQSQKADFISIPEGIYQIGYNGEGFCFDNELNCHKVYLEEYQISNALVTNAEYLEFIDSGAYQDFKYWHAEARDWININKIIAPLYWYQVNNDWHNYTLGGIESIDPDAPVSHISYYEAHAYAEWRGLRLPTEFEWEAAAPNFNWGQRWEWTESAYLPYPGFKKATGAIGEYNGKFMVNQMVLRGASEYTTSGHSRITYRNFFHPYLRWQYTGIRLAKSL